MRWPKSRINSFRTARMRSDLISSVEFEISQCICIMNKGSELKSLIQRLWIKGFWAKATYTEAKFHEQSN